LAQAFTGFYEACPVLKADDATRDSRLVLCAATATTLRMGLGLSHISNASLGDRNPGVEVLSFGFSFPLGR